MNSYSDEQFLPDARFGKMPRASVYELLVAGYTLKIFRRITDGVNSHKILRLELSKDFDASVTEFTIADQFEMVLHFAKTKLDQSIAHRKQRKITDHGSDKTAW